MRTTSEEQHNMSNSDFGFDGGESDSDFALINQHRHQMMNKLLMHHHLMKTFWSKHKLTIHLVMMML